MRSAEPRRTLTPFDDYQLETLNESGAVATRPSPGWKGQIAAIMSGATPATRLAYACALVGTAAYIIGYLASWWLPEPKSEKLPG